MQLLVITKEDGNKVAVNQDQITHVEMFPEFAIVHLADGKDVHINAGDNIDYQRDLTIRPFR